MVSHPPVRPGRSLIPSPVGERRQARRIPTTRMVRVAHDGCITLARCRDISDSGVKLCFLEPIDAGERVEITFSPRVSLGGRVVWSAGGECGIAFDREIDSMAMLANTALEARSEQDRLADRKARHDHSPQAPAATHRFRPGLNVVLMLESGAEEPAVLDWTLDRLARLLPGGAQDASSVVVQG